MGDIVGVEVGVSSTPGVSVIVGPTVDTVAVEVAVWVFTGVTPGSIVLVIVGVSVIVAVSSGVEVGGEHSKAK